MPERVVSQTELNSLVVREGARVAPQPSEAQALAAAVGAVLGPPLERHLGRLELVLARFAEESRAASAAAARGAEESSGERAELAGALEALAATNRQLLDAIERLAEQAQIPEPPQRDPPSYRFTIERDAAGRMATVRATPE